MAPNDFLAVKQVLSSSFVVEWPQSKERIRGGDNFARMNAEYPSHGRWRFTTNRLVAQGNTVVTHVSVTDGKQAAEPISFFTTEHGKVLHRVEYWPGPFSAPPGRSHLVEAMA